MMNSSNQNFSHEYSEDDHLVANMLNEGGSGAPTAATPRPYHYDIAHAVLADDGGPAYERH